MRLAQDDEMVRTFLDAHPQDHGTLEDAIERPGAQR
jgi:hypothetical protein